VKRICEATKIGDLETLMNEMLRVCRCIALLHLNKKMEFAHCDGLAAMIAGSLGECKHSVLCKTMKLNFHLIEKPTQLS